MSDKPINRFMEKIMAIDSSFAGMGTGAVGIIGATSADDQTIRDLRKAALDFAAEYAKPQVDLAKLVPLSETLEASLQTTKLFYGLSDQKLDELLGDIDTLLDAATPR